MSRPSTPIDTGNRYILCKVLNDGNYVWAVTIHTERETLEYYAKRYLHNSKYGYMILEFPTKIAENIIFDDRLCNILKFEKLFGKWKSESIQ
jgi:hypothetical protein